MGASAILKRFAKTREAAYLKYGRLTTPRAQAISQIYQVADFFSHKSDQIQLRAVRQVESQIREILPSEDSRYQHLRNQMLDLLRQLQPTDHGREIPPPSPDPARKAASHPKATCGTQLRLI